MQFPNSNIKPSGAPPPVTGREEETAPEYVNGNGFHAPAQPTYLPQRQQERRATAKLDYYKKLAELQQMNLEFGRNIREAQQQTRQTQEPHAKPVAARAPNGASAGNLNNKSGNGQNGHPLTAAFHVATKSNGSAAHGAQRQAATSFDLPTLSKPLAQSERVTASLDFNRLLELQRRYDEAQSQPRPAPAALANQLTNGVESTAAPALLSIEDRLAARLLGSCAPRLPLRDWANTEERQLTPIQPQAAPHTALPVKQPVTQETRGRRQMSDLERRVTANPAAHYGYQPSQALQRNRAESLEPRRSQQFEQASERIREALLDPTRIDPHLISLSDLNPRAAKYYDQVAVSLISISYKRLLKRVLIASALHGEGRTCVALNLAGALARARQRVLVVDCDLLNPSVLRLLGLDAPVGLSEAVHRGLSPNAAALRVQPAAFNLLPMREKVSHSAELLASPRFHELIQLCEADYDFLLFDSSPLLESPDANLLAGLTDATLMVIRPGYSTTQQMAKAVSLFNEKDICGVVLNRISN